MRSKKGRICSDAGHNFSEEGRGFCSMEGHFYASRKGVFAHRRGTFCSNRAMQYILLCFVLFSIDEMYALETFYNDNRNRSKKSAVKF